MTVATAQRLQKFVSCWLRLSTLSWVPLALGIASAAEAQTTPSSPTASDRGVSCVALQSVNFADIQGAPTQVTRAKFLDSAEGGTSYCQVEGYVVPQVGFVLLLPASNWNRKFIEVGCGGWCGTLSPKSCESSLRRGYACIATDMGHTGAGGLWLRDNLQGQIDFSYRATHVTSVAGKAIASRFYRSNPRFSYFMGCSTGGYQGMVEAQRFPWDFNGIIAGAPDMDESDLAVRGIWLKRHFLDMHGRPLFDIQALRLIHAAALKQCSLGDGLEDGTVRNPVACKFEPKKLECKSSGTSECLTPEQVRALAALYGTPVTSKGESISSRGVFPGSELQWLESFQTTWGDTYFRDTALLAIPGREWSYLDFDFDRDYQRSGTGVIFADTNPDLRRFKAAGGKLISYQGANDTAGIPGAIIDYYETVERTMGGRAATLDFFRLFVVPGMRHCSGGDGAYAIDYLSYLEAWVEQGNPPEKLVGAHVDDEYLLAHPVWWMGADASPEDRIWAAAFGLTFPLDLTIPISFTRPVYPYPMVSRYSGHGNPNAAASFNSARP
jgi:hypothetical protein